MQNCYSSNRIPRENMHDQDERLTKKHIETLGFVKEIAEENKVLKQKIEEYELKTLKCAELHALAEESQERIKKIQEQYLKRADEINAMMAEKHKNEMMYAIEEKLDMEKRNNDEIARLKARIQELEKINKELLSKLNKLSESDEKVSILQMKLDEETRNSRDLRTENDTLREAIEALEQKNLYLLNHNDSEQLARRNKELKQEVQELVQKNTELNYKISHLEQEVKDSKMEEEKVKLIENLKVKITQMQTERGIANERERHFEKIIKQLQNEVETSKEQLVQTALSKQKLYEEYQKVFKELEKLKKQYAIDSHQKTFKDFVQLKRQLNTVKNENEDLKQKAKGSGSLPTLKDEAVTTKNNSHLGRPSSLKAITNGRR
ncbi:protein Hook homolog 3-like [Saccostrea cucullata]|uniref:protein Hook homolog 3-like n=1 Tax=Saccostrea cuccullata TaxID=36930 RepID=UPI002ED1372B